MAGDGRIMTEGGGHSTSDDLSLDLAAGKKLKEMGAAAGLT